MRETPSSKQRTGSPPNPAYSYSTSGMSSHEILTGGAGSGYVCVFWGIEKEKRMSFMLLHLHF